MTMLVTLEQVHLHCRITQSVEDDDVVEKIHGASAAVLTYLGTSATFIDSNGDVDTATMPREVRQAVLKLVESFFSDRGGDGEGWNGNYLPKSVQALLYPLRDPAAC